MAIAPREFDRTMIVPGPVLVMGAGAIGCYVGGLLANAGLAVSFVGRPRVLGALAAQGLTLSAIDAPKAKLTPGALELFAAMRPMEPALVLLCVKSGATAQAAAQLEANVPPGTLVLSLQNGVGNANVAAAHAPSLQVLAGLVPFNVVEMAPGHYHRATSGEISAQDHPGLREWQGHFARAGLPLHLHADMQRRQWGKLLLNLNNPVNALSGLPLKEQLLNQEMRSVTAALQREALGVLRVCGIRPISVMRVPLRLMPHVLELPTWLFRLVAASSLRIDERARSSMADDMALGRTTEIDALCGEVVRLAAKAGLNAPVNARMLLMVNAARHDKRKRSGKEMIKVLGL